jgi:hypothetical protein
MAKIHLQCGGLLLLLFFDRFTGKKRSSLKKTTKGIMNIP